MNAIAQRATPLPGVLGGGDDWRCDAGPAWFELRPPHPFAGRWLRLSWAASFTEPPCRGVLRFVSSTRETDLILAAPVLGRNSWIGVPPEGTERILFSPAGSAGPFRFRLLELDVLSTFGAFREALAKSPARAVLGLFDAAVGLGRHARINFEIALKPPPLGAYPAWRKRNLRLPEPDGLDRLPPGAASNPPRLVAGDAIPSDAAADDLVAFAPHGARLTPHAAVALAAAALAHPDADGFHGDVESHGADGAAISCRFVPDGAAASHGPVFWRAGRYRNGVSTGAAPRLRPLLRPLISLPRGYAPAAPPPDGPPPSRAAAETAIIIPTRDRLALLKACIDSLIAGTSDPFRLIIVDNDSRDVETLDYLAGLGGGPRGMAAAVTVHRVPGPFNFSQLCNAGARLAMSPYLAFLNNDTTVVMPSWLSRMQVHAARPGVGAVGAKLLFPSGQVQHAGVVLGINGIAGHFESGLAGDDPGVFGRLCGPHEVTAVTGACLMIGRERFLAAGGFDEVGFPIELNDIDLCLRLREMGLVNMLAGDVLLTHHESASRGRTDDDAYPEERGRFRRRWAHVLRADPYFHPALSLYGMEPRLG
jgi:O-antigen biosynthesis protein